jgi:large subunit ribosomal protein L29
MALKAKEIRNMSEEERKKKLEELRLELVKARTVKTGSSKIKEIRRMIARILTINNPKKLNKKSNPIDQ